jgi:hypothetical protein
MTPSSGTYTNATNLFSFSECSINAFKLNLLNQEMSYAIILLLYKKFLIFIQKLSIYRNVSDNANCLSDIPKTASSYISTYYKTQIIETQNSNVNEKYNILPGQDYDADQQCKLIFGSFSRFCNGVSKILN